jgi:Peptidase inhibitor family I36
MRGLRRSTITVISVAALLFAGLLSANSADASSSQCPDKYFCFWQNANYNDTTGGSFGKIQGSNKNWGVFASSQCPGGTWNNCASSYWNRTNSTFLLYDATGCSGAYFPVPAGSYGNLNSTWNDKVSSNFRGGTSGCS